MMREGGTAHHYEIWATVPDKRRGVGQCKTSGWAGSDYEAGITTKTAMRTGCK